MAQIKLGGGERAFALDVGDSVVYIVGRPDLVDEVLGTYDSGAAAEAEGGYVPPEFPFYLRAFDCWVHVEPESESPGEVRYDEKNEPHIILREYDERVLFHECLHVALHREKEALALLGEADERLIRYLTRWFYAMGWRWRKTDRDLAQIEYELSYVAQMRDALARELDGDGAPVREWLDRPAGTTVYAVEWGSEFPAEIDSLWLHERDALNQVRELNQRRGGNWHVRPWTVE